LGVEGFDLASLGGGFPFELGFEARSSGYVGIAIALKLALESIDLGFLGTDFALLGSGFNFV
jgi:hypothetical protein